MKKTLAAVLAAAMALSTATVAFASDAADGELTLGSANSDDSVEYTQKIGSEKKYAIDVSDFDLDGCELTDTALSSADLYALLDAGWIKITPKVTSGKSNLASNPSISTVKNDKKGNQVILKVKFADTYKVNAIKPDTEKDPLKATIKLDITFTKTVYAGWADDTRTFTTKDDDGAKLVAEKGDTIHAGEVTIKSGYYETDDYGTDMTFTSTEVKNRETIIIADNLVNEIGDDAVNIYFGDTAVFTGKIAATQKNLNVYYTIDEIDAVVDAYPDVEFEFVTFKGKPAFTKAGEMTFNAIGGKNTTVYSFDGETLQPLTTSYDSTYGTVTAKNIKKLDRFVVASEVLEVEEPEEPASSEPVEAPSVEKEENPNTGAC